MAKKNEGFERGMEVIRTLGWGDAPLPRIGAADREYWAHSVEHLFGHVWARPGLALRDRELVTLSILIALNQPGAVREHFRTALGMGFTPDELREVVIHASYYAGWPAGTHAIVALKEAVEAFETGKKKSVWKKARRKKMAKKK